MNVIELRGVSKAFRVASTQRMRTLRDVRRALRRERTWALRDVSFDVAEGTSVGIIGGNGAGKSTLLRVISGVTRQTRGTVRVQRRVSGLLTLGEAFHHDLTGEENAVTQAILAGFTRREALLRLDDIAEFSGLAGVIDQPLRAYSDGMRLRLAFAVAITFEPEILMVDELLAVGDMRFRQRCLDRLDELSSRGVTTLMTSHDATQVRRMCDWVVWLRRGRVEMTGPTERVLDLYAEFMAGPQREGPSHDEARTFRGSHEVRIRAVRLLGPRSARPIAGITTGTGVDIEIDVDARDGGSEVLFSIDLHRQDGEHARTVVDITSADAGAILVEDAMTVRCRIARLDLPAGRYAVSVGAYPGDWSHTFDYRWKAATLSVEGPSPNADVVPPCTWVIDQPSVVAAGAENA